MTRWGYLTCGFMVACGGGSSGKNGDGGQCPDELSACQDECFDLATDPANCGICGHQCRPGQDCIDCACLGGDADSDVDSDADSDADPCEPGSVRSCYPGPARTEGVGECRAGPG